MSKHGLIRIALATSAIVLFSGLVAPLTPSSPAQALSGTEFDAGNIISDQRFFDAGSMSEVQIQDFLNEKNANCATSSTYLPCLKSYVGLSSYKPFTAAGHCQGYSSPGYESAARIIWRVAQTCGISPQVLLVLLEKEQGLVSDRAPSERQYRVAMGYACPDTADCDAQYFGFFNQVYSAAWQLRQYTNFPDRRYKIGPTAIQYHPNAGCGSSTVNIANQATANLYNYTPYQPNQAALANLGGLGDSCSAYGNRNFWVFFYNWFGPPTSQGPRQIANEYAYQGGPTGPFGPPITGVVSIAENGGGLGQAYAAGSIYWTASTGAQPVYGAIRDYYFAAAGAAGNLGWPTSRIEAIPQNGGGVGQAYQAASVYSSAAGTFRVSGAVRSKYFSLGGAAGDLGFPITEQKCGYPENACMQTFQGGAVVGSTSSGAFIVSDAILTAYLQAGGPAGSAGLPRSAMVRSTANQGGTGQMFSKGSIYAATGGPGFLVRGVVRSHYFSLGGSDSWIGWPISNEACSTASTCTQDFQQASIKMTSSTTAAVWSKQIEDAFSKAGGSAVLGAARSGVVFHPQNGGGVGQAFANGSVYSKPNVGAFAVRGSILSKYFESNGAIGVLGWPTSIGICEQVLGSCSQQFESGGIYTSATTGTHVVPVPNVGEYLTSGAASGPFGLPYTDRVTVPQNNGGTGQAFTGGSLFHANGGTPFWVSGKVKNTYFAAGGAAGSYGWPTSAEIPSSDNGGGVGQAFQAASIYSSPAGTYATWGPIRASYWSKGGSAGSLGWPSSALTCTPALCTQSFQHGVVSWSAAGGTIIR